MVNNIVKLSEYSMVDVNPTYYITGPGTTLLRPNLSREQVYEWEGQGYDVARLD